MTERQLGPIVGATLLHSDIDAVITSYQTILGYTLVSEQTIAAELVNCWRAPDLIGNKSAILASANGDSWLRIIENKNAQPAKPLKSYGWMALESNVHNVDNIRKKFTNDAFTIIGEPAYLQVSDAIKAMQVIGPAGEVNYLTQVDKEVPPFDLPMTTYETGSLFIPVLCTPNRAASLKFYQALNNADAGLSFETKVTVLNNAWGHDVEHQFPVATLQLDGKCLFEIDQVDNAIPIESSQGSLPSGIAMITCQVKNIAAIAKKFNTDIYYTDDPYYPSKSIILLQGAAGELIELVG
ncbi:hypothetical protein SAMN05216262_1368 [Colwellia chukchiensis]|uniref:VOC domain-containing protein n=1 Tax=Colwellia chukchiensis TaxID=641665 RepID=A0A1H7UAA0_9GAMM|nr:hypothetical protein [Colwellia chukchiensis]SEL93881.1 hypothetical protein SAMN05216262_1368 [Colwellia chukchiensis]